MKLIDDAPGDAQSSWEQLAPWIDEGLAALAPKDRNAIVLRFFKKLDWREVGSQLGLSDGAARVRVVRAVEGRGIVQTIKLPDDRNAFACMLGGDDRRTLYVCTSTASGPAMAEKRDGRIEIVRVDVPGAGLP